MLNNALGRSILVLIVTTGISCSNYKSAADPQRNIAMAQNIPSNSSPAVTIKSIGFYTWWWSDKQISLGFRADNAPPKNTYIKLEQWQNIGDAGVPHPDVIDVVCRIDNKGKQPADFVVSAVGDFKVESYGRVENSEETKDKDLDKVLESVPWTEEKNLGQMTIRDLAPGESREVKFTDFNLRAVLDKYSGSRNNDLWPWKLRVRINVASPQGTSIAQGQAILDLIPGD
jgi:hypothetical protein